MLLNLLANIHGFCGWILLNVYEGRVFNSSHSKIVKSLRVSSLPILIFIHKYNVRAQGFIQQRNLGGGGGRVRQVSGCTCSI